MIIGLRLCSSCFFSDVLLCAFSFESFDSVVLFPLWRWFDKLLCFAVYWYCFFKVWRDLLAFSSWLITVAIASLVQCAGSSQAVCGSAAEDTCWKIHGWNCAHIQSSIWTWSSSHDGECFSGCRSLQLLSYCRWFVSSLQTALWLLRPWDGCEVLWSVCLFVCVSVYSHNSKTTWSVFTKFLCMLPAPWLGHNLTALQYVITSVLSMTSRFRSMGPMGQNQVAYDVIFR